MQSMSARLPPSTALLSLTDYFVINLHTAFASRLITATSLGTEEVPRACGGSCGECVPSSGAR